MNIIYSVYQTVEENFHLTKIVHIKNKHSEENIINNL